MTAIMLSSDRWVFWFPFPAVFLPSTYIVSLPLFIHVPLQSHWEELLIKSIYFSKQSRHEATDTAKAKHYILLQSSMLKPPH